MGRRHRLGKAIPFHVRDAATRLYLLRDSLRHRGTTAAQVCNRTQVEPVDVREIQTCERY